MWQKCSRMQKKSYQAESKWMYSTLHTEPGIIGLHFSYHYSGRIVWEIPETSLPTKHLTEQNHGCYLYQILPILMNICQEGKGNNERLHHIWDLLCVDIVRYFDLFYAFKHVRAVSCGNVLSQTYSSFFFEATHISRNISAFPSVSLTECNLNF